MQMSQLKLQKHHIKVFTTANVDLYRLSTHVRTHICNHNTVQLPPHQFNESVSAYGDLVFISRASFSNALMC